MKINLSRTIINSSRAGFALGWLCSVVLCVLRCYAADDIHWLHEHLRTSSVTTLEQAACLGSAQVCAKEFCPKELYLQHFQCCDRQVCGNASVTD